MKEMFTIHIQRAQAMLVRLHQNPLFEWTTIAIILLSSLTIGVKSYQLSGSVQVAITVLDWLVTLYFVAEVSLRMAVCGSLGRFFRGGWNIFDFVIVASSLIPVDESEYALLARLLRLFRVMRLIYFVPQLRVLIGALVKAVPRIGYVALMMFIIFYFYAAIGNLLFEGVNPVLWGNIGVAMLTLFRIATFEDWTDVMYETMDIYPLSWMYYLSFIFLSAFVFLNMMIGVIIDALNEEHKAAETGPVNGMPEPPPTVQYAEIDARLAAIETNLATLEVTLRRLADRQHGG